MQVYKYLKSKKIQCRPLICGNIGHQPFVKQNIKKDFKLNNAKFVDKNGIYLPNHTNLNPQDIDFISKKFLDIAQPIYFND